MTHLSKALEGSKKILREAAFWWFLFVFFCGQAFILSGFSGLMRLWRMNATGFDFHRVGTSLGLAFFWTGLSLWVVWALFPERWRRPLMERFPSRRREEY